MTTAQQQMYDFSGGINTDASLLLFPENSTVDEQNFSLEPNGTRRRRPPLKTEVGFGIASKTLDSTDRQSAYFWRAPGGSAESAMIVAKVKNELWFYSTSNPAPSATKKSFTYSLYNSKIDSASNAQVDNNPAQFASVAGRLVVVGKYIEPTIVTYNAELDELEAHFLTLRQRDFKGVIDGLAVSERPTTLSDEHLYNLLNQGWLTSDITAYNTAKSRYPSNADISYTGKITESSSMIDEFSPDQLDVQAFGNTPAPKGRHIINIFDTSLLSGSDEVSAPIASNGYSSGTNLTQVDTSSAHGLTVGQPVTLTGYVWVDDSGGPVYKRSVSIQDKVFSVSSSTRFFVKGGGEDHIYETFISGTIENPDAEITNIRPTVTASFAGRAWYAGINNTRWESSIFFSQIIEDDDNFNHCYQRNDPTGEHYTELLDSDGGRLVISEAGGILRLVPFMEGLLVFADNGVWIIGPGEKGYFSPVSYSVRKIHDIGCIGADTVVSSGDSVCYFGTDGIYTVFFDPESRTIRAESLSINKVNRLYKAIPTAVKRKAFGVYEGTSQQIVWAYSATSGSNQHKYVNLLIYSKRYNAFIPYKLNSATAFISAGVALDQWDTFAQNLKFLGQISTGVSVTFFDFNQNRTDYNDFGSGEEEAYLLTGLASGPDHYFPKMGSYVTAYFNKTETGFTGSGSSITPVGASGCTLQARWDWADNSASGKFSQSQQAYRFTRNYVPSGPSDTFEDGRPVVFTKNKIRGRGNALQLKFQADEGKDTWLLGWSMLLDITMRK